MLKELARSLLILSDVDGGRLKYNECTEPPISQEGDFSVKIVTAQVVGDGAPKNRRPLIDIQA